MKREHNQMKRKKKKQDENVRKAKNNQKEDGCMQFKEINECYNLWQVQ